MFMTSRARESIDMMEAISRSQAVIEFDLSGIVIRANDNFCRTMGYSAAEIQGRHHSMFCEPDHSGSDEYRSFWAGLKAGEARSGTFKRLGKNGLTVWIEASYSPVSRNGCPYKIVKIASDVTRARTKALEDGGTLDAVSRSQAVIEFSPDGKVIGANENFCRSLGYAEGEIVGRHHSMFCQEAYADSVDYIRFWTDLASGMHQSGEFVRVGKGGRLVWIQAAYNPIIGADGRVIKVVKFATDVTDRMASIEVVAKAMRSLADGDLSQSLDVPFVPSMEALRGDFNEAVARLREIVGSIGSGAEVMAIRSEQIGSSAQDLLRRAEGQAASLEQTAAALDELTSTVAETSRRAVEVGNLASATRTAAEVSGEVVDRAIDAMSRIETSSTEIGSISGMIDEIAFQTNLLALNAGIEAARAGDAGRGFAVVAQEVRSLAQRSAEAARSIQQLIAASTVNVKEGSNLVGATGSALKDILGRLGDIDANVSAIAGTAQEQTIGIREIGASVHSLDDATQNNAALADENSSASADMATQAEELRRLVATFRVDDAMASFRSAA